MYFFILILCLNTITSMINTNVFFNFTDFQVAVDVRPTTGQCVLAAPVQKPSAGEEMLYPCFDDLDCKDLALVRNSCLLLLLFLAVIRFTC
jgi:hypothetical protein